MVYTVLFFFGMNWTQNIISFLLLSKLPKHWTNSKQMQREELEKWWIRNKVISRKQYVKIQINFLFCLHVYWNSLYITSSPPRPIPGLLSLLQETIHWLVKYWASLCKHLHGDDWLCSLQMDSWGVLLIDGFTTKPEEIHSLDVYPILVSQPWDVALIYLICRH